ncbi:hypothetical protein [Streptomyces sp. NPDC097610]|uniref:hypothetical protein n=1 Tax=Streptomyces sp. NPDC097610 TaxID=3157227 RepID=UPI00331B39CB
MVTSELTLPPEAQAPSEPAADMQDLADMIRALMTVEERKSPVVPLGGNLFDVVLFEASPLGMAVVRELDEQQPNGCGPVIVSSEKPWLYALVPPGTSRSWTNPHGRCFGSGRLTLAPLDQFSPPGRYWLRPCQQTHLVGPRMLADALSRHRPAAPPASEVLRT